MWKGDSEPREAFEARNGMGRRRSRRRRNLYQVARASDGAHTLAVRNADVPEFVSNLNMAPGHGALPKNLAELSFAIKLRLAVCLSYSRAFENSAENLIVLSHKKHKETMSISS